MGCRLRAALLIALMVVAALIGHLQKLPRSLTQNRGRATFSVERARADVERLAQTPHPVGSPLHPSVRDFLIAELAGLGLSVTEQRAPAALRMAGTGQSARIENVIATLRGRDSNAKAVLLTAHYDSAQNSRGAADDAAAVAALLETARVLKAGLQLRRDVIFLFSDAEEVGLLGARAFVAEHPLAHHVGLVVNFEARGTRGPELMYQTSSHNGELIAAFSRSARFPRANSLISRLSRLLPNDADTSIYERAGYSVLGFAFAEGLENYHRYSDSLGNLDIRSLEHAGALALDLASHAAEDGKLPSPTSDVVYFDVFGRALLWYPTIYARIVGLLIAVGWLALVRRELAVNRVTLGGLIRGAKLQLFCAGVALVVPVMLLFLRMLMVDTLSFLQNAPQYGWGDLLVVTALFLLFYSSAARQFAPRDLALGGLSLGVLLSLILGLFLPDASAPWQWTTLVALLVWYFEPAFAARHAALGVIWQHLAPLFVLVLVGPIVILAISVAGPTLMPIPLVIASTFASVFLPTMLQRDVGKPYVTAVVVGSAGFAIMLIATARSAHTQTATCPLVYAYNYGNKSAQLAAEATTRPPILERLLRGPSAVGALRGFTQLPIDWRRGAAPSYPQPPVAVSTHTVESLNSARVIDLVVSRNSSVRCVRLWQSYGGAVTTLSINGKAVESFVRFSPEFDELGMQLMNGHFAPHVWNIRHCGFADHALTVRLRAPQQPVKLRLVEEQESLPPLAGKANEPIGVDPGCGETWVAQDIEF